MAYIEGLVSVVIPTRNRAALLGRALDSALRQTYAPLEVIVVSDGSEDETEHFMREAEKIHDNVRFLSCFPGRGGNHARNMGIQAARGAWVAFLDDDDEWLPDKLRLQMELAKTDPEMGLICTAFTYIQDATGYRQYFCPNAPYDASRAILEGNCVGSTTTVMARHTLLEACGLFDEEMPARQDYDMWVRLCQLTRVGVVRQSCVEYHNLAENGQISWNYRLFISANARLREKYGALRVQRLSPAAEKKVRSREALSVARKAFKAGRRDVVRQFAREALGIRFSAEAMAYLLAASLPAGLVIRAYTALYWKK